MDPIRRKLVELRDEVEQTLRYAAERSGGTSSGVKTATQLLHEKIDAILADWDAADEIRPREATQAMIEAATDLDNRTFLEGEWPRMDDEWQVMWDAYKQEQDK